jgi:ComF family protein
MEGLALVNYEDAASVLHQYKEKLIRNLAKVFAQQLAIALQQVPLPDRLVLVPVPSARKTTRTRGFSPAKEIAAELAPLLPGHVSVLAALRVRAARRDQAGADQSQRWQNLNERFSVVYQPPQGSEIWLVDDIVTTGATLLSAQQALLESGVKTTKFITFAETKLKIPRG